MYNHTEVLGSPSVHELWCYENLDDVMDDETFAVWALFVKWRMDDLMC